jgi:glycosyltransferase involved in cell wall biosynthesis
LIIKKKIIKTKTKYSMPIKILMFGWELPPHNSGGLGVACHGILKAMSRQGDKVTFVLPRKMEVEEEISELIFDENDQNVQTKVQVIIHSFDSLLSPYITSEIYDYEFQKTKKSIYAPNLVDEVYRYSQVVDKIKNLETFEIIHCHDWLTIPAGLEAKKRTNLPLVLHIHATEMDRTGGYCHPEIYNLEKYGMEQADKIVAVSEFTRQSIINNYSIDPNKVEVVHNGIDSEQHVINNSDNKIFERLQVLKQTGYQIVLFTGRLTFQKGVEYLLEAAKKSIQFNPKSLFIIAGSGDMEIALIEQASKLRISDRVIFTGFLRGKELNSLYQIADLLVMPSVSEPFGLVALESALYNTPVIISKQSGVSEVMQHSLQVDFWDIDEMTDKIVAVLEYESLRQTISQLANKEAKELSWYKTSDKLRLLYQSLILGSA